ncbi:MAG: methylated-DNA-[protein]-cysteine S-methyltransferase [Chitinophagales bacterium]|jgi:methylated-DNA-[protein]-cysteine S-methyltransferase
MPVIANADGANAIVLIVPCLRIIGSAGKLVGYAGGILAKAKLLDIEGDLNSLEYKLFH